MLVDSLSEQRGDVLYVTEWWIPVDEASAG